jgi:hypothetical protein
MFWSGSKMIASAQQMICGGSKMIPRPQPMFWSRNKMIPKGRFMIWSGSKIIPRRRPIIWSGSKIVHGCRLIIQRQNQKNIETHVALRGLQCCARSRTEFFILFRLKIAHLQRLLHELAGIRAEVFDQTWKLLPADWRKRGFRSKQTQMIYGSLRFRSRKRGTFSEQFDFSTLTKN